MYYLVILLRDEPNIAPGKTWENVLKLVFKHRLTYQLQQ